jgi:hypothetical protein
MGKDIGKEKQHHIDRVIAAKKELKELDISPEHKYLILLYNHYDGGKNVTFVWQAIEFCYENILPFPDWVNQYLLFVSRRINAIDNPGSDVRTAVVNALGLGGEGKAFTQWHDMSREVEICREVEAIAQAKSERTGLAVNYEQSYTDLAKKLKISKSKVKKIHLEYKHMPFYPEFVAKWRQKKEDG